MSEAVLYNVDKETILTSVLQESHRSKSWKSPGEVSMELT